MATLTAADIKNFETLPQAQSCRLIDFDTATVVPGFIPNTYILIVAGTKPMVSMEVRLSPRIYIAQPDHWEIEVVGCQSGMGLPQIGPYIETVDISGVLGKKGIEVKGANKSQKIAVP